MDFATVDLIESAQRCGAATLIGAVLGIDRELRRRPAGLKTHALVSLGASLVTYSAVAFAGDDPAVLSESASRAVQGVIAGVGFLGGGAILKSDSHENIQGLTTAASIWVVASLGIACGAGLWAAALSALGLALLVLIAGGPIEKALRRKADDHGGPDKATSGS
jgi:putative Mg2+ transporter-C (MgtC) family protein